MPSYLEESLCNVALVASPSQLLVKETKMLRLSKYRCGYTVGLNFKCKVEYKYSLFSLSLSSVKWEKCEQKMAMQKLGEMRQTL